MAVQQNRPRDVARVLNLYNFCGCFNFACNYLKRLENFYFGLFYRENLLSGDSEELRVILVAWSLLSQGTDKM